MLILSMHTESFTATFPLVNRAVCVLWLSREGLVSREEITAYFMRASVICSKLGLGFVHNFQETTYMKPTFCDNCSGFVSPHTSSRMTVYDEIYQLKAEIHGGRDVIYNVAQ